MHAFSCKVESDHRVLQPPKFWNFWFRTNWGNSWYTMRFCLLDPWISILQLQYCKGFPHWALSVFFNQHNSKVSPAQPNKSDFFFYWMSLSLDQLGFDKMLYPSLFSQFALKCSRQKKFISHNCGIFHNFNVGKFLRHPTLANVELPEAWLEWDYNCVNQIKN